MFFLIGEFLGKLRAPWQTSPSSNWTAPRDHPAARLGALKARATARDSTLVGNRSRT